MKTVPCRMARMVLAWWSHPMSFAKWLNVPAGKTASGRPASGRDEGLRTPRLRRHRRRRVPGPVRLPRGARLCDVVVLGELDDLGFRQLPSNVADDARPGPAAESAGLTARTTPAPSVRRRRFEVKTSWPTGACAGRSAGPGAQPGLRWSPRRCRSPPRHHWDSGHRLPRGIPRPGPARGAIGQPWRGVFHPNADRGGDSAGGVTRRQRIGLRVFVQASQQRNGFVRGPLAAPHPLGHLIGDQARHRKGGHTAAGGVPSGPVARHRYCPRDHEPQFGVMDRRRRGERRHPFIEQRTRWLGNAFEELTSRALRPAVICRTAREERNRNISIASTSAVRDSRLRTMVRRHRLGVQVRGWEPKSGSQ